MNQSFVSVFDSQRERSKLLVLVLAVGACATYEDQTAAYGGPQTLNQGGAVAGGGQSGSSSSGGLGGKAMSSGGTFAQAGAAGGLGGAFGSGGSADLAGESGAHAGGSAGMAGTAGTAGTAGMAGMVSGGAGGTPSSGGAGGGGSSGAGGGGASMGCLDPIPPRGNWKASASASNAGEGPERALDGDAKTRWTSGAAQSGSEWFQVDLGARATISHVNLELGGSPTDFPVAFELRLSDSSQNWGAKALVTGSGAGSAHLQLGAPAPSGRYLLLKQTGSGSSWWSIAELELSCAK